MIRSLRKAWQVTYLTFDSFVKDNCFQFSAATAFYSLFSLAPIVVISVYVAGLFFGSESAMAELREFLINNIGEESSKGVMTLAETVQTNDESLLYLILSIVFLIISSTSMLVQLQYSFNQIFKVKPMPEAGVVKVFRDRALAFGMIMLMGAVMILSLIVDSVMTALLNIVPVEGLTGQVILIGAVGNGFSIIMILFAIMVMFYILPDVRLPWKPLFWGSFITTLLLVFGKFLVGMVIGNSSLTQLSGASSSVIILMLWVYYSGIIIFFGIELVKVLAKSSEGSIEAGKYARKVEVVELETKQGNQI